MFTQSFRRWLDSFLFFLFFHFLLIIKIKMGEVTVFPFSVAGGSEIVVLLRRDENLYRDLGGSIQGHFSPLHAASFYLLKHT